MMQPPEEEVAPAPAGNNTISTRNRDASHTQQQLQNKSPHDGYDYNDNSGGNDDDDDDEPVLKYQRMGVDVGQMLLEEKEEVVVVAVHDGYLVSSFSLSQ